jgi:acyl-CoA reductase-like NAD-dependent aldehyde dehydrogenase
MILMHFPIKAPDAEQAGIVSVVSPFDSTVVGSIETVGMTGLDRVLNNSVALYRDRSSWLPAKQRAAILERTARLMEIRSEQLIKIAVAEGGKPYQDTRVELIHAIDGMRKCREGLDSNRDPTGPVVAVSPFNHPLNLIVHQIGPAITAGCPVIIKPSEKTPLSAFALVDILREASLPDGWCQPLLTEDLSVAEALVFDPRVAFFSFIGSTKVGRGLRARLPPEARCELEYGSAVPVIIAEDADFKAILPLLVKGGFYHAGQVCVSVQRIYVHRSTAGQLAENLARLAAGLKVGDPADPKTEVGPMIQHQEVDRVEAWVNEALAEGAKLLAGGERISTSLYRPTVLLNPSETSKVSC